MIYTHRHEQKINIYLLSRLFCFVRLKFHSELAKKLLSQEHVLLDSENDFITHYINRWQLATHLLLLKRIDAVNSTRYNKNFPLVVYKFNNLYVNDLLFISFLD